MPTTFFNERGILRMLVSVYCVLVLLLASIVSSQGGLRSSSGGVLYPQPNQIREVLTLDGVWNFILDSKKQVGLSEMWFAKDIDTMAGATLMPVPSSYNDIVPSASVRDHVGLVWYDRKFYVPNSWNTTGYRVWLRFSSVNYHAYVWINGKQVMEHEIGHLPFREEITSFVKFEEENKVTVAVDNILNSNTVPQGYLDQVPTINGPKTVQRYTFDFYNYAGIDRSVHLYTTPKMYIDDIDLSTDIEGGKAFLNYNIVYKGHSNIGTISSTMLLLDREGQVTAYEASMVESGSGNISGRVTVPNPKLWWPYLMDPEPGYLYTVKVSLNCSETGVTDVYQLPYGFRTVSWDTNSIYVNGKPIYIRGFGRHEDSDIRGKGLDLPTSVKDHNLLKWVGANTYRTSHYPYAEEIMDLAESQGIMIIDESPSVDTQNFSDALLEKHKTAISEMIKRDKNRACVILWSVANEPRTANKAAEQYFRSVVEFLKSLDSLRPVTAVIATPVEDDQAGQFMDVICFNRYNAWYQEPGQLESIQLAVEAEALRWRDKHTKPVIMSEFGADTYEGLHTLPDYIWSEEYQNTLLSEHFKAFDNLQKRGWFIGEMIWNFADFKTDQSITRVGGNKKGIFTRQRQPKSAAFLVRQRNFQLAFRLDGVKLPKDLFLYTSDSKRCKEEL